MKVTKKSPKHPNEVYTMYTVHEAQQEKCFESEFERHRKQLSRKQQLALEAVDGSSTPYPTQPTTHYAHS